MLKDQIPYPLPRVHRQVSQVLLQLPARNQVQCACGLQPVREFLEAELELEKTLRLFVPGSDLAQNAFQPVHLFHALLREADREAIQFLKLHLRQPSERLRSLTLSCLRLVGFVTEATRGLGTAWTALRGAIWPRREFLGDEFFRCGMLQACFRQLSRCWQILLAQDQTLR